MGIVHAGALIPRTLTPLKMKGITVVLKCDPPASPTEAIFPYGFVVLVNQAKTSPPTLSIPPPH